MCASCGSGVEATELDNRTACLAWAFSADTEADIRCDQLRSFHAELRACAELVGASFVEACGTHGLLICRVAKAKPGVPTEVDAVVRLGQLLCRWGSKATPEIRIRVGVDVGELHSVTIQDVPVVFGRAASVAKKLAHSSPRTNVVHLSAEAKHGFRLLESVSLSVRTGESGVDTYLLEPWVAARPAAEAGDDVGAGAAKAALITTVSFPDEFNDNMKSAPTFTEAIQGMDVADFRAWLEQRGVATNAFGVGHAKSVEQFHEEIVKNRAYLRDVDGQLERRVELVRVSIHARDDEGTDWVLTLAYEIFNDGRARSRNLKLAAVVPDGVRWQYAVQEYLTAHLYLSEEMQLEALTVEGSWLKEERIAASPSVPGMPTVYMTRELKIRVNDPRRPELSLIGLPDMKSFWTVNDDSGGFKQHWSWQAAGERGREVDVLQQLLADYGISVAEFEPGAFDELLEELGGSGNGLLSKLMVRNGELRRYVQIVKVWLHADILSVPHVLVHGLRWHKGVECDDLRDRPIAMKMPLGQSWQDALSDALLHKMGLDRAFQEQFIVADEETHKVCEEFAYSKSYPGLPTVYCVHEVSCRVAMEGHSQLGLPHGLDFSLAEHHGGKRVVTHFMWRPREQACESQMAFQRALIDTGQGLAEGRDVDPKRRLPAPEPLRPIEPVDGPVVALELPPGEEGSGDLLISRLLKGKTADWGRAQTAARRIRDADYSLGDFYEDCCAAFPELALYVGVAEAAAEGGASPARSPAGGAGNGVSGGRSGDDEYQRTMGALFAVYWLMRLDTDGAAAFCFGVDDDWRPLSAESTSPRRAASEMERRRAFFEEVQWSFFQDVLTSAGLLADAGGDAQGDAAGASARPARWHNEERTLAMLALTAIHDIMKVKALVPTVAAEHGSFRGYAAGEAIHDHDVALGYVLERYPGALPSFQRLPKAQQETLQFTQGKMEFNMGWLVQAEAPPGAVFMRFREIILGGGADQRDIAFYFTHWLTDLAGACTFPQEGCEKFVLQFPRKVLMMFLNSFPFVQQLSTLTETQVYEAYLQWRWKTHEPAMGELPEGRGSVASLRLLTMAGRDVLEAYRALAAEDQDVLEAEFARTGCGHGPGCDFELQAPQTRGGPAFLLMYAPALLATNKADPGGALRMLAEVLRQTRALWPLDMAASAETVLVQLDTLKGLTPRDIRQLQPGEVWIVQRLNAKSAQVKKIAILQGLGQEEVDWSAARPLALGGSACLGKRLKMQSPTSYVNAFPACVDSATAEDRHLTDGPLFVSLPNARASPGPPEPRASSAAPPSARSASARSPSKALVLAAETPPLQGARAVTPPGPGRIVEPRERGGQRAVARA